MVWFDLSWMPGFFQHEALDVRLVGEVKILNGRRWPGEEVPVPRFVGAFYPEAGDDAEKDDPGQFMTGDATVYTAFDLPISDNEVDPPVPGARLYHHGRSYEFIAKQWWTSGGYYRYTVRLRTHLRLIPPPNPGGGGGG